MTQDDNDIEMVKNEWWPVGLETDAACTSVNLTKQHATLWALVLDACSVPCCIIQEGNNWQLLVPPEKFIHARQELTLFEEENRHWPPPDPPELPLVGNALATVSVLLLIATFHNLTRIDIPLAGDSNFNWLSLGAARADLIRDGQWWRAVTALTLHANWPHLLGNLAIGGVFIVSLCRELGSGLAWSLILSAGILGNLANALMQQPNHNSVGASTAVFGAVGILAAVGLVRRRIRKSRRWLLPVAGAVALLAVLGTEGEHTDLGAHLFGFVVGICLGTVAGILVNRVGRPTPAVNAALALLAGGVMVIAWWAALMPPP